MGLGVLLTAALTLPVAADSKLEIANIRLAHDAQGPMRDAKDNVKLLPGDRLYILFDIGGLRPDDEGRIRFATILEIIGKDGEKDKTLFKQNVGEVFQVGIVGTKFRHSINLSTGFDQKTGPYKIVVTIEDLIGKGVTTFDRSFTVAPMELGIVAFRYCYDKLQTAPAPAVGLVGQTIYIHCVAVGLKPDGNNAVGVGVEMTVLDDANKPISAKPWTGEFKNLTSDTVAWPFFFELPVQKPGTYKITIKATDLATKKQTSFTTSYTVLEAK